MSIQLFIASDGRKFMSDKTLKKYEAKLFAQSHLQIMENPIYGKNDLHYVHIKNKEVWSHFVTYLKVIYFNTDFTELEDQGANYLGKFVLIFDEQSPVVLKTFEEYKEQLLTKTSEIKSLISSMSKILIQEQKNKTKIKGRK